MRSIINRKWHHMDHIVQDKLAAQTVSKQRLQVPRLPLHAHQMSKIMSNTQHMHFFCTTHAFCACATSNQKSKACVKLWKTLLHLANICHKFYKALCLVLTKQKGSSWVLLWTQTARQSCIGSAKQFGETNKSVKVQRPSSLLERTAWLAWSKGLRVEETRRHGRPSALYTRGWAAKVARWWQASSNRCKKACWVLTSSLLPFGLLAMSSISFPNPIFYFKETRSSNHEDGANLPVFFPAFSTHDWIYDRMSLGLGTHPLHPCFIHVNLPVPRLQVPVSYLFPLPALTWRFQRCALKSYRSRRRIRVNCCSCSPGFCSGNKD